MRATPSSSPRHYASPTLIEHLHSAFAFFASATLLAATGCRRLMHAALRWPVAPARMRWTAGIGAVTGTSSGVAGLDASQSSSAWVLAWPGMVVLDRLLLLAQATVIVLGDWSTNRARIPAVLGLPATSTAGMPDIGATTALVLVGMAAFFGRLVLEFCDVVPTNLHLFPMLRPQVRRGFAAVAGVGFVLTVLLFALLYAAAAALLQGTSFPDVAIAASVVQGTLLAIVAVPALWALVLGLLAVFALACALLWLVCTALHWFCVALAGDQYEHYGQREPTHLAHQPIPFSPDLLREDLSDLDRWE